MSWSDDVSPGDWQNLPAHLHRGVTRYIEGRIEPGGFLRAVIENNLMEAFAHADATNIERMKDIVAFFYWAVPSPAWGSPEKYEAWLKADEQ